MWMADPKAALVALARAYSLSELVSMDDFRVRDAVEEATAGLRSASSVELRGAELRVADEAVPDPDGSLEELARDLALSGVRGLRVPAEAGADALLEFLRALREGAGRGKPERSARELAAGVPGVGVLFAGPEPEAAGVAAELSTLFGGTGGPSPDGTSTERASEPGASGSTSLDELVDRYLEAGPEERTALRARIRSAGARTLTEEGPGPVAEEVERLALDSVSGSGDPAGLELARDLLDSAVAAVLVERVGSSREEGRREKLMEASARLGSRMATAFARALAETEDRSARSTYIQAMVALGEDARDEVEAMLDDSRWFVLRNGARVMGGIGTEADVRHLTAPLAHEDARVRQETVRALARIGGEDAVTLLQGMVNDPDPDVRAATATALGTLGSARTVKVLLERLEVEDAENAQIQILRALGALGDPGAVPALEKRAAGTFFSRPPAPVRIAAYRALASIGTPHATALLEVARDDREEPVRTAVRSLLDARESREG